jgi:hypothetical protein
VRVCARGPGARAPALQRVLGHAQRVPRGVACLGTCVPERAGLLTRAAAQLFQSLATLDDDTKMSRGFLLLSKKPSSTTAR